jgi:hypothetical protein
MTCYGCDVLGIAHKDFELGDVCFSACFQGFDFACFQLVVEMSKSFCDRVS